MTKLDWIISFPTIRPALSNGSSLEAVSKEAEKAIQVLLTNSHKTPFVRRYKSRPWSGFEGSLSHLLAMTGNMVEIAHRLWMEIYLNRKQINHIHIIAPGNAAIFAIRFLAFFTQHGNGDYSIKEFDRHWSFFPMSVLDDDSKFPVDPLFRSLTLIHPSLPTPGFMARHLLNLPDIYSFTTRKPAPMPAIEMLCVFTSNDSDASRQNININVDPGQVYELPYHDIEKVLTGVLARNNF